MRAFGRPSRAGSRPAGKPDRGKRQAPLSRGAWPASFPGPSARNSRPYREKRHEIGRFSCTKVVQCVQTANCWRNTAGFRARRPPDASKSQVCCSERAACAYGPRSFPTTEEPLGGRGSLPPQPPCKQRTNPPRGSFAFAREPAEPNRPEGCSPLQTCEPTRRGALMRMRALVLSAIMRTLRIQGGTSWT